MKGFPNQIVSLEKLTLGIRVLADLVQQGANARDDGVFGEALVRAGVAGTGHIPIPVEEYIQQQRLKAKSDQSFRTTARGLREFFRLMGFIDDSGSSLVIHELGQQASTFGRSSMSADQISFWRHVVRNIVHDGGDGQSSHPYQVLLRLVARKPGITRAKCALALEAKNDSLEELERVMSLVDLDEDRICETLGVSRANWDNAKKVLPAIAEQLHDVIRTDQEYVLADAPGKDDGGGHPRRENPLSGVRAPRTSRMVTPESIGRAGTKEAENEIQPVATTDPVAAAEGVRVRLDRLRRHNLLVQRLASYMPDATLYEDPFDILVLRSNEGVIVEVKTLDGSTSDERDRVRDAAGQLLYYSAFVMAPLVGEKTLLKVACFEGPITSAHQAWLGGLGILSVWVAGSHTFGGDEPALQLLGLPRR